MTDKHICLTGKIQKLSKKTAEVKVIVSRCPQRGHLKNERLACTQDIHAFQTVRCRDYLVRNVKQALHHKLGDSKQAMRQCLRQNHITDLSTMVSLPLKQPRIKRRCLKASSSFFYFSSQLWKLPLPAGTRMRPGSAGASQHLQKLGHIHTRPKQGLKSLIFSVGVDHDKDLPRQTRPQEMTQSEASMPDCLAQDSYVPTNTPGQSELNLKVVQSFICFFIIIIFICYLQITNFLAFHPIDTFKYCLYTQQRLKCVYTLKIWHHGAFLVVNLPAGGHLLNEKGTSKEELGVHMNYSKHLFRTSMLTKSIPPQ